MMRTLLALCLLLVSLAVAKADCTVTFGASGVVLTSPNCGPVGTTPPPTTSGAMLAGHMGTNAAGSSAVIKNVPATLYTFVAMNTGSTVAYLKFIDKATTPVCGIDPVLWSVPLPFQPGTSGAAGVALDMNMGLTFTKGIAVCVTKNAPDSDAIPFGPGVVVSVGYR